MQIWRGITKQGIMLSTIQILNLSLFGTGKVTQLFIST